VPHNYFQELRCSYGALSITMFRTPGAPKATFRTLSAPQGCFQVPRRSPRPLSGFGAFPKAAFSPLALPKAAFSPLALPKAAFRILSAPQGHFQDSERSPRPLLGL
jgi:hypothetical protein